MYTRIRNLREDKDLSQREMAEVLSMSQTGYSKYETGENDVPTSILRKLATFHKTSTDYILGLTDEDDETAPEPESLALQKSLGEKIQNRRKDVGLNQEKFALQINMGKTYFAAVEAGKQNMSVQNLKKIADGLNISLSELLRGL